ncbi:hypothetical protein WA026_006214 [Henosepilachna vigintioctopunctata]|uniref:Uncharacterized protein n=1 Tax=Henosepilachna vigintioctopunctata TaxID=420089 RepID=A0AAW1TNY5_9CUCU
MPLNKFGHTSHSRGYQYKHRKIEIQRFPLTPDGEYDFKNHKLCNIKTPTSDNDGATKSYVDSSVNNIQTIINDNYQLLLDKYNETNMDIITFKKVNQQERDKMVKQINRSIQFNENLEKYMKVLNEHMKKGFQTSDSNSESFKIFVNTELKKIEKSLKDLSDIIIKQV